VGYADKDDRNIRIYALDEGNFDMSATEAWARWTKDDLDYLLEHQKMSDEAIAAVLRCDPSRVKRKRYALRLFRSEETKRVSRKAARQKQPDVWNEAQLNLLETHVQSFAAELGSHGAFERLKPLLDAVGPARSLYSIQQVCNRRYGKIESEEQRQQRLAARRLEAAQAKLTLRQIPYTLGWDDLAPIVRTVILFSVLGDASLPKAGAGAHHYYTETHALYHRDYLLWKRSMLPECFRGNFYEDPVDKKDPRCVWETGVSQIFSTLRPHLYPQINKGFKSIISEWVIEQIKALGDLALLGLLIWHLDDGRNASRNGYPNLEICIERWEFRLDDVRRVCDFFNATFGLTLRVRPGRKSNTLVIPAETRNRLVPIWRKDREQYGIPACMDYKYPEFTLPINGPGRRLTWEQKHPEIRHRLAITAHEMRLAGASFREIGQFLESEGHPLLTTNRYLPNVWGRLGIWSEPPANNV
jgi:hypothetical protein